MLKLQGQMVQIHTLLALLFLLPSGDHVNALLPSGLTLSFARESSEVFQLAFAHIFSQVGHHCACSTPQNIVALNPGYKSEFSFPRGLNSFLRTSWECC